MADGGSAGDPHRRRPHVSGARRPDGRSAGVSRPGEPLSRRARESAAGEPAGGDADGPTPADVSDPRAGNTGTAGPGAGNTGTGGPGAGDPGTGGPVAGGSDTGDSDTGDSGTSGPGAGSTAQNVRAFLRANPQVFVLLVVCLVLGIGTFVAVLIALATAGSDQTTGEPSGAILGTHALFLARSLVP